MEANAPERIYVCDNVFPNHVDWEGSPINTKRIDNRDIEYIRKDAFIERALKWYCLDCECNDNCKNTECFFKGQFRRYLKGNDNAIPPKICDRILNEDGTLSENWRYRHIIDTFIDKAAKWISNNCYIPHNTLEDFKNYMKGR